MSRSTFWNFTILSGITVAKVREDAAFGTTATSAAVSQWASAWVSFGHFEGVVALPGLDLRVRLRCAGAPDHRNVAADDCRGTIFIVGYGREVPADPAPPGHARRVGRGAGARPGYFPVFSPDAHIPPSQGISKAVPTCRLWNWWQRRSAPSR